MSHHLVEVKKLFFSYDKDSQVLEDISFRIIHGESVAILGENGSGKSTLLYHLNGCLRSKEGQIKIGDYTLDTKTIPLIRKTIGMIFQDSDDQLFMPNVYDDVAFGPLNMGLGEEDVKNLVNKALQETGITHLAERRPYKLSGGEKKKVAIATVLAMSPDILVLDEPSSNLDPKSRLELIGLLGKFKHTKIMATHDLDLALDLCPRSLVLHQGKITYDGSTLELFKNDSFLKENHLTKPLRMQKFF